MKPLDYWLIVVEVASRTSFLYVNTDGFASADTVQPCEQIPREMCVFHSKDKPEVQLMQ